MKIASKKLKKLVRFKRLLELIPKGKKNITNFIATQGKKEYIHCICECILNIIKGNIKISKKCIEKLKPKKKLIRKLIEKSALEDKKKIIQKGGFIEILIPSIISGLASIISSVIINNKNE